MLRWIAFIAIWFTTYPALCESNAKYQIGTITEVKAHINSEETGWDLTSYDVSVQVGDTVYVVLYKTPVDDLAPKYAAGRELLVLVGKDTISYNDLLGRSREAPIESQKRSAEGKRPK